MVLNKTELSLFKKLKTPQIIQDYLDSLKINHELKGESCRSPREVILHKQAHCIEAAMFAAAVFLFQGKAALLLDLKAAVHDYDHVVALFKQNRHWGAISKSNHGVLRFREPVYKTIRELVMSYFHEYTDSLGRKTLRSYSKPYNMGQYDEQWMVADFDLWSIAQELDRIKHYKILTDKMVRNLRRADKMERKIGEITEWKKK